MISMHSVKRSAPAAQVVMVTEDDLTLESEVAKCVADLIDRTIALCEASGGGTEEAAIMEIAAEEAASVEITAEEECVAPLPNVACGEIVAGPGGNEYLWVPTIPEGYTAATCNPEGQTALFGKLLKELNIRTPVTEPQLFEVELGEELLNEHIVVPTSVTEVELFQEEMKMETSTEDTNEQQVLINPFIYDDYDIDDDNFEIETAQSQLSALALAAEDKGEQLLEGEGTSVDDVNNSDQDQASETMTTESSPPVLSNDNCDCLIEDCPGCHYFPCPKCGSHKCADVCRVGRTWQYTELEVQGRDEVEIRKAPEEKKKNKKK